MSVDLDFFTTRAFDPLELVRQEWFPTPHTVLQRTAGSLAIDSCGVKVEFLLDSYPLLEVVEFVEGLPLLSLEDVIAMKLNAIANRGSRKDFFDLDRILQEYPLASCLDLFDRKYPNTDRFVVIRSLAWFDDAEQEPDPIVPDGPTWPEVKLHITDALKDLS